MKPRCTGEHTSASPVARMANTCAGNLLLTFVRIAPHIAGENRKPRTAWKVVDRGALGLLRFWCCWELRLTALLAFPFGACLDVWLRAASHHSVVESLTASAVVLLFVPRFTLLSGLRVLGFNKRLGIEVGVC